MELTDGHAAEFGVVQIYDNDINPVRCYAIFANFSLIDHDSTNWNTCSGEK